MIPAELRKNSLQLSISTTRGVMTTAVSDILKQVEPLSNQEKLELAARLIEQAQPNGQTSLHSLSKQEARDEIGEDAKNSLEDFDLNHKPLLGSHELRLGDGGRIEPSRYDFSDVLAEETERFTDVFELNHVPPARTYTIRARYQFAGHITPLPYHLEEEE